jgi:hypothetical protein
MLGMRVVKRRLPTRRESNSAPKKLRSAFDACSLSAARVAEERPRGGLATSVHKAAGNGYTKALNALLLADGGHWTLGYLSPAQFEKAARMRQAA